MRYRLLMCVLIGTGALSWAGCSAQRRVKRDVRSEIRASTTDTVREHVVVEVFDTLCEVTTIIIRENENRDTMKWVQGTDRTRVSDRAAVRDNSTKTVIRTDTVFVVRRDSVVVDSKLAGHGSGGVGAVVLGLRWVFGILVVMVVLVVVWRAGR